MSDPTPDPTYLDALTWEEKARVNPLYGVMSVPEFVESTTAPSAPELARFYDEGRQKARRYLLPWLGSDAGLRVLEFGCGMGRLLRAVAQVVPRSSGVDISPTMLDLGRPHLPPSVELRPLNADGTFPFPDQVFDRVYSMAVLQHIRQRSVVQQALGEIARVLVPGGRAKLQFLMSYPPPFQTGRFAGGDAYAFEWRTVVYGWTRRAGIPLWRLRVQAHTHWRGARPGYRQLWRWCAEDGLTVSAVEREPDSSMVWLYVVKR